MISHIHIGTSNLLRAVEFYDVVLKPLNIRRKFVEEENGWAGWKSDVADRPLFLVGRPFNGAQSSAGNGAMVALLSPSRRTVDLCYEKALKAGATDEGKPGLRPNYHSEYYGAYFRDLDDNKVCICCHDAE